MNKNKITDLLIYIVSAELAGALSGIIAGGSFGTYYDTLIKPPLSPPGWLFPLVWAVLYALMGLSAYIIGVSQSSLVRPALTLYLAQLFLNLLWGPVFFGLRSFGGAVAAAAALLAVLICMLIIFSRINKCAVLINLPYALWSAFALYLSVGFFVLNS